ncbi:hypothetical protein FRC02_007264 [Tulasnella sp. 418]|nr:hypothetical protein FRC02_007264 [Tulasnella sp. 418]
MPSITMPFPIPTWIEQYPFSTITTVAGSVGIVILFGVCKVSWMVFVRPQLSPLKDLPGPEKNDSLFWGNLKKIFVAPAGVVHEEWAAKYGPTFTYRGFLSARRFFTMDPRAVNHVLTHSIDYPKPEALRTNLSQFFGKGLLFAEGEDHRRQRRIMNPTFGPLQIKPLIPIFFNKSHELRDIWLSQVADSNGGIIDIFPWVTKATLDIIGLAGFDYNFDSLANGEKNELVKAFNTLFGTAENPSIWGFLQARIPVVRLIPTKRTRDIAAAREVLNRVGTKLINDKRAAVLAEMSHSSGEIERKNIAGKDLLSVLIKSNMATDVKASSRMDDVEVLAQISTMLIAGHETTSTSVVWLLHELALEKNHHIQEKLREELLTIESENPSAEELNSLPYLEAVVRENLRLNAVVSGTLREAGKDDTIPLSTPYVDKQGVTRHEVKIDKGTTVYFSIISMHRDKSVWGEDAMEFKPERWLKGEETQQRSTDVPGVFAGLMTFIGGPRACIGYRFALLEMKALIFVLVRSFKYELSDPNLVIERKTNIVTRPMIKSPTGELTTSMPLRLTPVRGG